MSAYLGILSSGPSASLILDLGALTSRVAALLRRKDLTVEIEQWLNFVQRDMVKRIKFPELRAMVSTTMTASPATYLYNLPIDFGQSDRIYYRNTTDSNNIWGRNLIPLPRKFYAGDIVDLERLLNVSVPNVGDPRYYWIDATQFGIYPALASNLTGVLQQTYYKLPPDMTVSSHEPLLLEEIGDGIVAPHAVLVLEHVV